MIVKGSTRLNSFRKGLTQIACMANILLYLHVDCDQYDISLLVVVHSLSCRLRPLCLHVHIFIAVRGGTICQTLPTERHVSTPLKKPNNNNRLNSVTIFHLLLKSDVH